MRPRRLSLALLTVFLASCATAPTPRPAARKPAPNVAEKPSAAKPAASPAAPTPAATAASPSETPAPGSDRKIAVFLIARPDGNPAALASILEANPRLRLTIVFPSGYFDADARQAAAARFRVLSSSKQVEVALSLANDPILPLVDDLKSAGPAAEKWGIDFSWPEDVAAHVARASGFYQTRWGALPSGLYPPFGAASPRVIDVLRRFRLNWVLLRPSDVWGVRYFGGTAVVVPQTLPPGDESKTATAAGEETAQTVLTRPFSAVDANEWPTADYELQFVRALARESGTKDFETGVDFVTRLRKEYAFPDGKDPFARDYSEWTRSPQQKRAWEALADARKVVEAYKNSGRANLSRLDASVEEMCSAENGPFLLSLGSDEGPAPIAQRDFLATLANVYRLVGAPVPPNLNTWFADRTVHRTWETPTTTNNDRPFFVQGTQELTWNDPKGDDTGPGGFSYPAGIGPRGLFDLRDVTVSWTDTDVTISVGTAEKTPDGAPMLPAADIYIDVNRITDAGAVSLISQRGKGTVSRDAAWEYAVTLTPQIAVLYRGLPGGERVVSTTSATRTSTGFSGTFPRSALRGDPSRWRLSVGLGATEAGARTDEPPAFIPIGANATPRSFGGAVGPQSPPRYIDILAPSAEIQNARLKAYDSGSVMLPFVEAE